MAYRVQLTYFRITGKFLAYAEARVEGETLAQIWNNVHELRRLGRLPGLRVNAGRDLFILVDAVDHPERMLHLVMPPFVNDDDITPVRVPTGEMVPLVRVPLEELPYGRTSTRDVVKVEQADIENDDADPDEEDTPVDRPLPEKPSDE
jgi:hypothetical protein